MITKLRFGKNNRIHIHDFTKKDIPLHNMPNNNLENMKLVQLTKKDSDYVYLIDAMK
ncbi:hypothetical protein ACFFIS_01755 [Virgibacillus soli]|uniref:hypothetical protein n=1 Tax=Paracerasibacillus soli TaxID=480284 RepID=UPI0035E8BC48